MDEERVCEDVAVDDDDDDDVVDAVGGEGSCKFDKDAITNGTGSHE